MTNGRPNTTLTIAAPNLTHIKESTFQLPTSKDNQMRAAWKRSRLKEVSNLDKKIWETEISTSWLTIKNLRTIGSIVLEGRKNNFMILWLQKCKLFMLKSNLLRRALRQVIEWIILWELTWITSLKWILLIVQASGISTFQKIKVSSE